MAIEGFLGRVLTDPTTGLPNIPYFRLIRDWEEKRASRRHYEVRVLRIAVAGGDERIRRSLSWRLCREFRSSDLIASEGSSHFRVLLTSPDAENVEALRVRILEMASEINQRHPTADPLQLAVDVDSVRPPATLQGPCEPCDPVLLESSGEQSIIDPNVPPGQHRDTDRPR